MKKASLPELRLLCAILCLGFISFACTGGQNRSDVTKTANSNTETNLNIAHEESISETTVADEKAKLEQEKRKLEQDKAKLKKEKNEFENVKSATPPDISTENWSGSNWTVPKPPSNVRSAPDGKILCTITKKEVINLRGTSNIKDNNGEWLYTDYCGKIGFIHSSQVQFIDGIPAG